MSYDEYEEDESDEIKMEVSADEIRKGISIKVDVKPEDIVYSVVRQISSQLEVLFRKAISNEVQSMLEASRYWSDKRSGEMSNDLRAILREVVKEKLEAAYPDIVENKVNQMAEEIKKVMYFTNDRYDNDKAIKDLKAMALKKIDEHISAEVQPVVAAQTEKMQEYVQNIFAQNFVKAMIPLGIQKQD